MSKMAGISVNLKQLRLAKKMTQEEVAQEIGLTRQAISSYESGRTQPSVDLLMRFAEIYEVELEEILYGQKKEKKERKRIIIAAIVTTAMWLVCKMIYISLIGMRYVLYPMESWIVDGVSTEAADKFFYYGDVAESFVGAAMQVIIVGCFVMCVLDWTMEKPVSLQKKLLYIGAVTVCSVTLTSIAGTLFVPEYQRNFWVESIQYSELLNMLAVLGINLIGLGIKKIIKRKNKV